MPLIKKATILFDLSHKEMLNIEEKEYSEFHDLLQRLSVKIKNNESKDLTKKILDDVDILILGNPIGNQGYNKFRQRRRGIIINQ